MLHRAATRLSERMDPVPDEIWDVAARHYDEPALAALIIAIATINAWNLFNITTRQVAGWRPRLSKQMIQTREEYSLHPIGHIRSTLRALDEAPRQGSEGAPDAWLEVDPTFARGLFGIATGDEVIVVTWLHRADRDVLEVHPRDDPETRSPECSPHGLHTDQTRWDYIA